jgi:hypothetical protein
VGSKKRDHGIGPWSLVCSRNRTMRVPLRITLGDPRPTSARVLYSTCTIVLSSVVFGLGAQAWKNLLLYLTWNLAYKNPVDSLEPRVLQI